MGSQAQDTLLKTWLTRREGVEETADCFTTCRDGRTGWSGRFQSHEEAEGSTQLPGWRAKATEEDVPGQWVWPGASRACMGWSGKPHEEDCDEGFYYE
jgi:hypothetical protein